MKELIVSSYVFLNVSLIGCETWRLWANVTLVLKTTDMRTKNIQELGYFVTGGFHVNDLRG